MITANDFMFDKFGFGLIILLSKAFFCYVIIAKETFLFEKYENNWRRDHSQGRPQCLDIIPRFYRFT